MSHNPYQPPRPPELSSIRNAPVNRAPAVVIFFGCSFLTVGLYAVLNGDIYPPPDLRTFSVRLMDWIGVAVLVAIFCAACTVGFCLAVWITRPVARRSESAIYVLSAFSGTMTLLGVVLLDHLMSRPTGVPLIEDYVTYYILTPTGQSLLTSILIFESAVVFRLIGKQSRGRLKG